MRKLLLPILIFLSFFAFSVKAQNPRIPELAKQVEQRINSLAENSAKEFFARPSNSRDQTNNFLILQQSKMLAGVFVILVNYNRPSSELRETADSLNERFNRYDSDSFTKLQFEQIKKDIDELSNELKKGSNPQNPSTSKKGEVLGRLYWHGTIDDEVQLVIRDNVVQAKTISGTIYEDALFNFTSPLPAENTQVLVNKKEGRGTVKVIQQPTADNNFTAIVQILDKNGGAREYDLEIYWTR